jgi:hypothetical protein
MKSELLLAQSPLLLPHAMRLEMGMEGKTSPAEAKDERVSVAGEIEKCVAVVGKAMREGGQVGVGVGRCLIGLGTGCGGRSGKRAGQEPQLASTGNARVICGSGSCLTSRFFPSPQNSIKRGASMPGTIKHYLMPAATRTFSGSPWK